MGTAEVTRPPEARDEVEGLRESLAASGLGLGTASQADPAARPAGPAEAAAAARMLPGRSREFLAGRLAARRALGSVGLDCGDIPRSGRLPVFPPGRAASITHSAGLAVAVARAPGRTGAPGCDLEFCELPLGAARFVLREDEETWLRDGGPALVPARLLALFSAKEAAWKAFGGVPPGRSGGSGPARDTGTLRDLRAVPVPGGFRVQVRGDGAACVLVRVHPLDRGVFSWGCR